MQPVSQAKKGKDMPGETVLLDNANQDAWRVRVALLLDLMICAATLAMFVLGLVGISRLAAPMGDKWSIVLPFFVLCAASALLLGVIAHLARRGQTIGLAMSGLRWTDGGATVSGWRVLGEPQFWCASVPALYICLNATANIWIQRDLPVEHPLPIAYLFPLLVCCAVLLMAVFRRRPGRLSSCNTGSVQ